MGWSGQVRSNRVGLRSNKNRSRHVTRLDRAFWNRRSGFVYHMSVDGADRCAELPTALRHFFGVKVLGIPVFPLPRRIGMPGGLQPNRMAHDTVGQEGPSRSTLPVDRLSESMSLDSPSLQSLEKGSSLSQNSRVQTRDRKRLPLSQTTPRRGRKFVEEG
jgi:hypothetical protein